MEEFQIYISGEWKSSDHYISVFNPYTGEEIARVAESSRKDFDLAVKSCELGFKKNRYLPAFQRAEILHKVSELLSQKEEEFAQVITNESGKAIKYSRGEVRRAVENLQFSAEAAKHVKGKVLVPDAAKGGIKHKLFYERFPLGIIAAITPFNFPLNLVVHKIAPAIAAGNSVLLKPSSLTPITSIKLIELFLEAGLPPHAVNLVIGRGDIVGDWITGNEKINMITFTGSPSVGKWIKNNSGMKKVSLELGANSPLIIDEIRDWDKLISRCVTGVLANGGQVCISTQRIYINTTYYDEFKKRLTAAFKKVNVGNPTEEKVEYSSLISEKEAVRIEAWLKEAEKNGANIITGGKRFKSIIEPTLVEDIKPDMKIYSSEIFGPVAVLIPYDNFSDVLDRVNNSQFGLNAGVYTSEINKAFLAYEKLESGAVIINDIPTWRVDHMPYGGVKNSGSGREGPEFAIEEMSEIKLMVFADLDT